MKTYIIFTTSLYSLLVSSAWLNQAIGPASYLVVGALASFFIIGIGLLRHEHWHRYDKTLNNTLFHDLCSYAVMSDANCYLHGHLSHHKHVHTEQDLELYGPDYHRLTPAQKRRRFLIEFFIGNIHWELTTGHYLAAQKLVTKNDILRSVAGRAAFLALLFTLTAVIYQGPAALTVALHFGFSIWVSAVVSRHLQWMQHLGIFVDHKDPRERSLHTRALVNSGILEKVFNTWTHTEVENHIFHHTDVQLPISKVRVMKIDATAPVIDLKDYVAIARDYYHDPEVKLREKA